MAEGFQELTKRQLVDGDGILSLNNMLRALFSRGERATYHYGEASSTSADAYAAGPDGIVMTSTIGYRMPKAGSIVRHTCLVNVTTATSDDVTMEIRVNNTNQSDLELEFASSGGTGVKSKNRSVDRNKIPFAEGDIIQVYMNETGTMVWDSVIGSFEVIFDND